MIYKTSEFVFFTHRACKNSRIFLKYLGVKKKSYAGRVARRLYNEFFGTKYKLNKYYKKYYGNEYESCSSFLINRWNLGEELAKKISKGNYYFTVRSYKKDNPSYYFDYDENLKSIFYNFVGGISYEN